MVERSVVLESWIASQAATSAIHARLIVSAFHPPNLYSIYLYSGVPPYPLVYFTT